MSWQPNKQAPLDEETQKVLIKALCDKASTDPKLVDIERVAYVPQEIIKKCQGKFGTICGKKGNTFSFGVVDLLKKCSHVLMFYRRESDNVLIISLAVSGLSKEEAVKLGILVKMAGGSLKPDFKKIGKERWAIFESE